MEKTPSGFNIFIYFSDILCLRFHKWIVFCLNCHRYINNSGLHGITIS